MTVIPSSQPDPLFIVDSAGVSDGDRASHERRLGLVRSLVSVLVVVTPAFQFRAQLHARSS